MNTIRRILVKSVITGFILSLITQGSVLACTSFVLKANGIDLNSRLEIVPCGHESVGHTPDGKPGLRWRGKYGVVALDALEKDVLTDGLNEKDFVVGVLYLPGFTECQQYDPNCNPLQFILVSTGRPGQQSSR